MAEPTSHKLRNTLWTFAGLVFILWLAYVQHNHWWRAALLTGLAAGSYILGTFVGFVFTSYQDETSSIGKVKDWLIGGLATLTVVEFQSIKPVLRAFSLGNPDHGLILSVAIVFSGLGFFFMFFGRELIFNVPLALARRRRTEIEMHAAGVVTLALLSAIPPYLLFGITNGEDLQKTDEEKGTLKALLNSADVEKFLQQCSDALRDGSSLEWDVVTKVANIEYYRSYFMETDRQTAQQQIALDWIVRALVLNPEHIDFAIKRIDTLANLKRYGECVALLQILSIKPESPYYAAQWLGFYALYVPGLEKDAIAASEVYLQRFPASNESLRNIASGYAQMACRESRAAHGKLNTASQNYKDAIRYVQLVLADNPGYATTMAEAWIKPDGSFSCFGKDPAYRLLVGLDQPPAPVEEASATQEDYKDDGLAGG